MLIFGNNYNNTQYGVRLYLLFIIHDFLFLTCMMRVYANLNGMSHSISDRKNNFMPISHLEKNGNFMSTIKFAATTKIPKKSNGISKINQNYCIDIYRQNNIINEYDSDSPGHFDTISQDDIVRNQYLSLPYPAVSQESLQSEQNHYHSDKWNTPFSYSAENTLESINHFLYKGGNDFR